MLMNKAAALLYVIGILEELWESTHNDQLQRLLGDIQPGAIDLREGELSTGDPAGWHDWVKAIDQVTENNRISYDEAKQAIVILMSEYNKQGFHLQEIIDHINNQIRKWSH